MKRLLPLALLFILCSMTVAHKFYVSMTDINWNESQKSLELTSRFFSDDIERLFIENGTMLKLEESMDDETIPLLAEFYSRGLELDVNGELVEMEFLGYELEDELLWCYAEVKLQEEPAQTRASCNWLTRLYDGQINILKFFGPEGASTIHLSKSNPRESFLFQ